MNLTSSAPNTFVNYDPNLVPGQALYQPGYEQLVRDRVFEKMINNLKQTVEDISAGKESLSIQG